MTTSKPATTIINHYSSEGESGSTLPEQWKLTRMRRRNTMINRADANMIRGTHQVIIDVEERQVCLRICLSLCCRMPHYSNK